MRHPTMVKKLYLHAPVAPKTPIIANLRISMSERDRYHDTCGLTQLHSISG